MIILLLGRGLYFERDALVPGIVQVITLLEGRSALHHSSQNVSLTMLVKGELQL